MKVDNWKIMEIITRLIFSQENGNFGIRFYKRFYWTSNPLVFAYSNNSMGHTMPGQLGKGSAGASVTFFLKQREYRVLWFLHFEIFKMIENRKLKRFIESAKILFEVNEHDAKPIKIGSSWRNDGL